MKEEDGFARFTIAIVGLGLMGGSLALALNGKCKRLFGVDRDKATLDLAFDRGVLEAVDTDPGMILPQADIIILALPVRSILEFIPTMPEYHSGPAIVIDIGSTKIDILSGMSNLPAAFDPIGGHPMCGKEVAGFENADPEIFKGAPFALTPLKRTSDRAKAIASELVQTIGAEPIWLDPETHDSWVATTSHLPYLLAVALVNSAPSEVAPLVGPGFRDVSRLAGSDRQMMVDILSTNGKRVLMALQRFQEHLGELDELLKVGDHNKLTDVLVRASQQRDMFYRSRGGDEARG
jgi:prephenate dehydrogenase